MPARKKTAESQVFKTANGEPVQRQVDEPDSAPIDSTTDPSQDPGLTSEDVKVDSASKVDEPVKEEKLDGGVEWNQNGQWVDPETGEVFYRDGSPLDYNPDDYADAYNPAQARNKVDFSDLLGKTDLAGTRQVYSGGKIIGHTTTSIEADVDRHGKRRINVSQNHYKNPENRLVKSLGNHVKRSWQAANERTLDRG